MHQMFFFFVPEKQRVTVRRWRWRQLGAEFCLSFQLPTCEAAQRPWQAGQEMEDKKYVLVILIGFGQT